MVSAVVLAAGESRRMEGPNKLLLPWGGKTLVEHTVDTLGGSDAGEIIVVVGHEAARVKKTLQNRAVRFVHNPLYRMGMTTSIKAGVRCCSTAAEGLMICLADLPHLETQEIDQIIRVFEESLANIPGLIVVPVFDGQQGNPVIFSAVYKAEILAYENLRGCKGLIQRHPDRVLEIEMATDHILRDIDTQRNYDQRQSKI